MPRRLFEACWNVLVVKGGSGDLARVPFFTLETANPERLKVAISASAISFVGTDGMNSPLPGRIEDLPRSPGRRASSVVKTASPFASVAWMVQYSVAVNAWMTR